MEWDINWFSEIIDYWGKFRMIEWDHRFIEWDHRLIDCNLRFIEWGHRLIDRYHRLIESDPDWLIKI